MQMCEFLQDMSQKCETCCCSHHLSKAEMNMDLDLNQADFQCFHGFG